MTKTAADEDGVKVQLLRNQDTLNAIGAHVLPDVLPEAGLSDDRRAYLLENVAAFLLPCMEQITVCGSTGWRRLSNNVTCM